MRLIATVLSALLDLVVAVGGLWVVAIVVAHFGAVWLMLLGLL
jgi:hypothetical protein